MQTSSTQPVRHVIVIGASYAAGWGTPPLPGHTLTNRGVGGEETTAMLARFDKDVIAAKPDAVIIWGHINDIFRAPGGDMQAAANRAKDNLRQMIERSLAAGIEPILATEVTLSQPEGFKEWAGGIAGKILGKKGYQERVNDAVRDVNAYLRRQATRLRLSLLDFEQAVDDGDGFRRREFSTPDGSHISKAGYDQLTAYALSKWGQAGKTGN